MASLNSIVRSSDSLDEAYGGNGFATDQSQESLHYSEADPVNTEKLTVEETLASVGDVVTTPPDKIEIPKKTEKVVGETSDLNVDLTTLPSSTSVNSNKDESTNMDLVDIKVTSKNNDDRSKYP